jgi:hypothetical protein
MTGRFENCGLGRPELVLDGIPSGVDNLDWGHLPDHIALALAALGRRAEAARSDPDQTRRWAGQSLRDDLRSIHRSTRALADGAAIDDEPVEPPEDPGGGWVVIEVCTIPDAITVGRREDFERIAAPVGGPASCRRRAS